MDTNFNFFIIVLELIIACLRVSGLYVVEVPVSQQETELADLRRSLPVSSSVGKGNNNLYYAKFTIGSQKDERWLLIDTLQSDTWIDGSLSHPNTFMNLASKTFQYREDFMLFTIRKKGKTLADGFWGSDEFWISGKRIRIQFGLSTQGLISEALGLAPKENEDVKEPRKFSKNPESLPIYPNFLEVLKQNGLLLRNVFSLWLAGAGYENALLFGGADAGKYNGPLEIIPMCDIASIRGGGLVRTMGVMLEKFSSASYSVSVKAPVLLDTSSALSRLPLRVVKRLTNEFNATLRDGLYWVNCMLTGELFIDFGESRFRIPIENLVLPTAKNEVCQLAIVVEESEIYTLGTTILKSLYIVFDLESRAIGVAQAKLPSEVQGAYVHEINTGIEYYFVRFCPPPKWDKMIDDAISSSRSLPRWNDYVAFSHVCYAQQLGKGSRFPI